MRPATVFALYFLLPFVFERRSRGINFSARMAALFPVSDSNAALFTISRMSSMLFVGIRCMEVPSQ